MRDYCLRWGEMYYFLSVLITIDPDAFLVRESLKMKIIIAKTAGFCMGVKRAVDLAIEYSGQKSSDIYSHGPLIHNKQTIDMLRQRGVETIDESTIPSSPSTVIIRAHGVPPSVAATYGQKGHQIVDGTCPKVRTVHKVIERHRKQGYSIVITGDKGHAEVIGLLGYAGEAGYLIGSIEEVDSLPPLEKVCVVSQTTFDRELFDTIAEKIQQKYKNGQVIVKKTICSATDQRQAETQKLAREVDALIVVGGKNSANTQRLAKISRDCGTPTQAIETEEELDWDALSQCNTIGVTAGASTPNWMITRVRDYLQFMDQTKKKSISNVSLHLFDIFANLNIFASIGAAVVYYVSCTLQGYPFTFKGAALSFLYFLSMYLWNSLASIESTQHHGISRYNFYSAHNKLVFGISAASIVAVLFLSASISTMVFYLMLFATVLGLAYHLTIVPRQLRYFLRYKKLKDIPTSRDLFVALAWATVLTFLPHVINGEIQLRATSVGSFVWIFILGFLRALIFDLRDIEGDRIMGRETLITIVGEKRARKAINLIIWACMALLLISPATISLEAYRHLGTVRFLFQVPVLFYIAAFLRWNPRIRSNRSALFSFLADGLFFLAGAGAVIATLLV
ncbi:4-hydroxy-3-methylbut-2-enyl diphosphate reductase [Chitinispirillales bacterium ANBcel5]|uniref:4-hydroxy-3-methylbut-2-enyl diphosphate reductase n=1 Tax=Cellulosispirillum alkaliphilum TaxID=3039283 RepID=UPI002A4EE59E|nr:4-hydroxy-3-methylbut-2-enyl diphosphate reductase [Chitinispirillales bacterium ANBcel5]